MKRLIIAAALLVLVQVGLTVWTHWGDKGEKTRSTRGALLSVQAASIDGLLFEDQAGRKLQLSKVKNHWLLPESGQFPADSKRIDGLLDTLVRLQYEWPEATTAEAAKRFKVAPENFVYRVSLLAGGKPLKVLYFGSSAGLRKLYFRVDNEAAIHSMVVSAHDLSTAFDDWIDTSVLYLNADQVAQVHLPGLDLVQGKEGLVPADLKKGEELVKEKRDLLVNRLTRLSISAILGKEVKPAHGLDRPILEYRLELKDGTRISYQFGEPPKPVPGQEQGPSDNSSVLKVSTLEQLLRVDGWQVEELKKASRAELVRPMAPIPDAKGEKDEPAETHIHLETPLNEVAAPAPGQ